MTNITQVGSIWRDDNATPIQYQGVTINVSKTINGNNTTVALPLFSVKGIVLVTGIWGVVTTVLGTNCDTTFWRLNDGTATSAITLATGTDISAAPAGSLIVKKGLAGAALTLLSASQERVSEPTTLETLYFSPFMAVQKTGSVATNIEFVYSTTDAPTSGAIQFFASYVPISSGAHLS